MVTDEDSELLTEVYQPKHEAFQIITKAQDEEGERYRRGDELLVTGADGETMSPDPRGLWFASSVCRGRDSMYV